MRLGGFARLVALFTVWLNLVACAPDLVGTPATAVPPVAGQTVEMILDYELLTRAQMIAVADAIFVGQVTVVSPTSWNQDSGKYWEQEIEGTTIMAAPIHQLEVAVLQPIVDEIGLDDSETAFALELSGFQAGESLVLLLAGEAEGSGTQIEERPAARVDSKGEYHSASFDLGHYAPINEWQGKMIHSRGVACFDIILPLPALPIE